MHTYTHAYRLKLEPILWDHPALTREALSGRLSDGSVIHSVTDDGIVEVGLSRESHSEAFNELLLAVQTLGYTVAEAEITKVADRAIEMAIGGSVTGGLGGSSTGKGEVTAFGAIAGWFVGLFVGSQMEKVEVIYRVQRDNFGWRLVAVPKQTATPQSALRTA